MSVEAEMPFVHPPRYPTLNKAPTNAAIFRNFTFGEWVYSAAFGLAGAVAGFAGGVRSEPRGEATPRAESPIPRRPTPDSRGHIVSGKSLHAGKGVVAFCLRQVAQRLESCALTPPPPTPHPSLP